MVEKGWKRCFDEPITLPDGRQMRTLHDAAEHIKKLPKGEHDRPEWRLAVQMLIDAAENRGPMLFARMGIQQAMEAEGKFPIRLRNGPPASTSGP